MLIPALNWKVSHHFTELEGRSKELLNAKFRGLWIDAALETIDFRLDRSGVELEAESHAIFCASQPCFLFDRPFPHRPKARGGAWILRDVGGQRRASLQALNGIGAIAWNPAIQDLVVGNRFRPVVGRHGLKGGRSRSEVRQRQRRSLHQTAVFKLAVFHGSLGGNTIGVERWAAFASNTMPAWASGTMPVNGSAPLLAQSFFYKSLAGWAST